MSILVGSYDTKIHLWNNQGETITSLPRHNGPIRSLAFIHSDESEHEFISGSHDQNKNSVESLITCKGHQETIETFSFTKIIFCFRFF